MLTWTWTWTCRNGVASLRLVRAWRRSRGTTRRSSCRVRVGRQRPSRRKPARCMRPWSLPCSSLPTPAPRTSPQSLSDPAPAPPYSHMPPPRADHIYADRPTGTRDARVVCAVRHPGSLAWLWVASHDWALTHYGQTISWRSRRRLRGPPVMMPLPVIPLPLRSCRRSRLYQNPIAWVSVCVWLGGRCASGAAVAVTVAGRERGVSW